MTRLQTTVTSRTISQLTEGQKAFLLSQPAANKLDHTACLRIAADLNGQAMASFYTADQVPELIRAAREEGNPPPPTVKRPHKPRLH
jgi:hypothetical protein